MSDRRTVYRVCPFCEATCGLTIEVEGNAIVTVRGDKEDPFSRGFICPKAYGLKELYHDPARLRQPVRRTANGWEEITWAEAYKVRASEHGLDLGPLQPRLQEILNTPSGMIELAPPTMTNDIARLRAHMAKRAHGMVLIRRRNLRTSNSFMHNLPALVKGPDRCTLQVSRQDAAHIGLTDGSSARITSRVGSIIAPVEVTEDLMPGVVSLPHGWGHDVEESGLTVAKAHPGVNTNILTDDRAYDEASGTAVLFGTPVTVEPLRRHPE